MKMLRSAEPRIGSRPAEDVDRRVDHLDNVGGPGGDVLVGRRDLLIGPEVVDLQWPARCPRSPPDRQAGVDAVSGAATRLRSRRASTTWRHHRAALPCAPAPTTRLVADLVPPRCSVRDLAAARSFAVSGRMGAVCEAPRHAELGAALCDVGVAALAAATFVDPTTGSAATMHAAEKPACQSGSKLSRDDASVPGRCPLRVRVYARVLDLTEASREVAAVSRDEG